MSSPGMMELFSLLLIHHPETQVTTDQSMVATLGPGVEILYEVRSTAFQEKSKVRV